MTMWAAFAAAGWLLAQPGGARAETEADEGASSEAAEPAYPDKSLALLVNPLGLATGSFGVEYGFAVADAAAIAIAPSGYYANAAGVTTTGFGVSAGVQFYPLAPVFHSLYVYPQLVVAQSSADGGTQTASATLLGAGATAGYQWTWDNGFSLRVGGGAAFFQAVATSGDQTVALAGGTPVLEGLLGYAW